MEPPQRGRRKLLLIDDDEAFGRLIIWVLDEVAEVRVIPDADEAVRLIEDGWPDAILSDLNLELGSGIELFENVRADVEAHGIPFALITGSVSLDGEADYEIAAREHGIDIVLNKDIGLDGLRREISKLLETE